MVTLLPRMSSSLMSCLRLNKSSRHSPTRLNSSRACMVWNNSTSVSRGVVISIALGTVLSNRHAGRRHCVGDGRLRSPDHQTGNGKARFEPQLAALDVRLQAHIGEHLSHVGLAVRI